MNIIPSRAKMDIFPLPLGFITPFCASSVTKPAMTSYEVMKCENKLTLQLEQKHFEKKKLQSSAKTRNHNLYIHVKLGYLLHCQKKKKSKICFYLKPVKDENPETAVRELRENTSMLLLFKSTNVQHLLKQSYYISTYRELT